MRGTPLRILHVEDVEDDSLLILEELRRGGFESTSLRVETAADLASALERERWDLILSDFHMPHLNALEALAILQEHGMDLPFIIISGTLGEENAVTAMKAGAHDFIAKGQLARLVPAVRRELREVENRRERRKAEEARHKAEASFRALIEESPDFVVVHRNRSVVYANATASSGLGFVGPEQLVGKTLAAIVHPDDVPSAESRVERIRQTGRPSPPAIQRWRRKDGSFVSVEVTARLVEFDGEPAILAAGRDVTERTRNQEQLLQSQRLEAIGQLAGGVAHDFNNLLTVIITYGEMLLRSMKPDNPDLELVAEITKAGERAASLTRQLLAFSRRQVIEAVVVDLNAIVGDMEKMLRRLIGEDIEFVTRLQPKLDPVLIDPGQLEQVILNLVVNARDAMPRGGTVTIESRNVDLDEAFVEQRGRGRTGPHVMLAITDTGHGMDRATQQRIFEPFFTTKGRGKGTGLGLSTVYGIVRQSGAEIVVYSEPGRGTTFKIYFPVVQQSAARRWTRPPSAKVKLGTETILLVEDEEAVRNVASRVLRSGGYVVLEAANGEEALKICERHRESIDLLVSDIVMPGSNGPEVAEQIRKRRPSIRVLFTSGYTDHAIVRSGVLAADVYFIQKPFTVDNLRAKVHEVLHANQP